MRKIYCFLLSLIFLLFWPKNALASSDYVIENFDSDIVILQDTTVSVVETIKTKFLYQKHGIFRTIPYIYSVRGKSINTHLQIESVTDENGALYPYTTSRVNQSLQLKIGDPDKTIIGVHTYIIKYRLKGVILEYDGIPEFYWNVTGHEWDTQIQSANAKVASPFVQVRDSACYTGYVNSKESNCTKKIEGDSAIFSTAEINPGEDFTIVVSFDPNNSFTYPSRTEKMTASIFDNWGYATAIIPFLIILYIWYKKGRDEKFVGDNYYYKPDNPKTEAVSLFKRGHIPLMYHPLDGLTPAQVGTILDERIDIADIIAEIVELARLKFLKIEKLAKKGLLDKQDYAIIKLKKDDSGLTDYQKEIVKELFREHIQSGSIFEIGKLIADPTEEEKKLKETIGKDYVTLSSLKNHFYVALPEIKKKVYKSLTEKGLFDGNPETVRIKYIVLFIVLNFASGFTTLLYSIYYYNFAPIGLAVICAAGGLIIALQMPKKTAWGYSLFKQTQGLREYLRVGKWRHENYEKNLFFEEVIPLAISLGVVGKLAADMADIGMQPPRYMSGFTMSHFATDLTSFQTRAASAFVSSPSNSGRSSWSGGSGFSGGSGGGFGGGGGGSW